MSYWEERQKQLNSQLEKDEEKLKKRLTSFYDTEYRKLEKQIAAYYQQYGENNVIEYRKLMESLPEDDRRLLIEQMDQFAEKYPQYQHLLPVRESIYKLNRLEGLQTSVRVQQLEIGAVNNEQIKAHLKKQALRGANAAAEAMGFGKNFYSNNLGVIKQFVDVPWANGKNFSQRIWENTDKLANYLNTDIAQGLARGDSYDRLAHNLRQRFSNISRNDAYRLIYTEGTYVMAESTMQPFVEDFQKYRVSTVDDGKVCSICKAAATQAFDIKDRKPGVNFPPLHTWCRCTFTIEVDDWDKWMNDYEKKYSREQAETVANGLKSDIIKDEKDISYKGIPKSWKMLGNATNILSGVNPHYSSGDERFKSNCTNCVSAYEMRKRGYNVTAKPSTGNHYLSKHPESAWIDPDVKHTVGRGLADILEAAKSWPDGARAEVAVTWEYRNSGHVFVAEKENGEIQFYDVQSGKKTSEETFNMVQDGKTKFWRIDNLEPAGRGITACEAGG